MPLFEDVRSSEAAPRVVSDDSQEYQQHGLMWRKVTSPQHQVSETKQRISPPRAVSVPPSHTKTNNSVCPQKSPVADDIESAVAGLLGISHIPQDPNTEIEAETEPILPERSKFEAQSSQEKLVSRDSSAAMPRYDPPRVPSYAALAERDTSNSSTKTVRLVPSKPRREAVPTLSLLPMKPKKQKC